MENFTAATSAIGGALIGFSAAMLMILHGLTLGVSGILSGALFGDPDGRIWRLAFLAGLVLAPVLVGLAQGQAPRFVLEAGYPLVIAGVLLVGLGARLGSGCTSGHGI